MRTYCFCAAALLAAIVLGLLRFEPADAQPISVAMRIQNDDLSKCIGVRQAWGQTFWPGIIANCGEPYTGWKGLGDGKIQNTELNTCLGVREAHGETFWPVVLVTCSDQKYTRWSFRRDGTIRNQDLGKCVGVREDWGAIFWSVIIVNCGDPKYVRWTLVQ